MNILMISDVYFPRVNGVSTSIMTFRAELQRLGHQVTLIAPDYGETTEDEADILRIPSRRVPYDPEDRMMSMKSILALAEKLRSRGYDMVHIHTPFVAHYAGLKLARRLGLSCVESYHTFFEEYLHHYIPLAPRFLTRFLARHFSRSQCNGVDGLVVPSRPMLDQLRNYGIGAPAAIIPTGIEPEKFTGGDGRQFRSRWGIPADRPVLEYVGRAAFEKNIDFLLEVTAEVRRKVPDVLLVVAGEGPAENHLRSKAAALGVTGNVLFVGYLDRRSALLDCYRAADVFVFASRTETQGLVLLEAMALGVPVVSTAIMGTREIVGPAKGALVAEDDLTDFSGKVLRLLADPVLRARLGAEGRAYVAEWSAARMAERLSEFYGQIQPRTEPGATGVGAAAEEA